ncbi:MAG: GTPase ObgE [Armatimonadetes bacterium]|nr:GTPase ObgE [Armatimonadota bacterium]MDE2206130.1 GTPase ObgE [Armatimonadota bacterium]
MFVDEVEFEVAGGSGGAGMVTFRKEKYVPHGGPNGGDGGHGGNVLFTVDSNLTTLLHLRYHHKYAAERGSDGGSKDMFGRNGADMIVKVPPGTVVTNAETGAVLADLVAPGASGIVAHGGVGGRGNAHFASSIHQAPRFAELGEPGEQFRVRVELKLLADVALLGFPNAGKSTLISAVSAARPKIANYPFTTLIPHLGVVRIDDERSFVMADMPGLIEGASAGAGLGREFLRHLERTRLLVHVLDVGGVDGRDPLQDYEIINRELKQYNPRLARLPQLVALNKIDIADPERVEQVRRALRKRRRTVVCISAATHAGVRELVFAIAAMLPPPVATAVDDHVLISGPPDTADTSWAVERDADLAWCVKGRSLERLVAMTDFGNEHAVRRLQRTLERLGVVRKLRALGAADGDTVRIRTVEFSFEDEDTWDETQGPAETGIGPDGRRKPGKQDRKKQRRQPAAAK